MKLYIAGPMTGISGFNYEAFREAERQLQALGYATESPVQDGDEEINTKLPWEFFMRRGLKQLLDCDGIATLKGIERSRGGMFELLVAQFCGLEIHTVDGWLTKAKQLTLR